MGRRAAITVSILQYSMIFDWLLIYFHYNVHDNLFVGKANYTHNFQKLY